MKVNFADNGNLKRGEAFITIQELQEAGTYYIGYREIKPSVKQIRSIINYLRTYESPHEKSTKGTMIVTTKVTHGMLIKVLNYDKYQAFQNDEGNNEKFTKSQRKVFEGHNINKKNKEEEEEYKEDNILSVSKMVLDYLNKKTGKAYRYSDTSLRHIKARLNEGYSLEDCKQVIEVKCSQWLHSDMEKYLRPETLFGSKFDTYLNEKVKTPYMTQELPQRKEATKEEIEIVKRMIGGKA